MPNRRSLLTRSSTPLVILIVIITVIIIWCEFELNCATLSFDQPSSGDIVPGPAFTSLLENLSSQKEQRASWAYAALAGLVAISVTKQKILPVPWLRAAYMLIAVAAVLLLESLHASELYDRRIAYLVLLGKVTDGDVMGLSSVLSKQLSFLYAAVIVLGIFVMSFVAAIVTGKITPTELGGD
jgi:hypothetical protein